MSYDLIKITQIKFDTGLKQMVNARDLHSFLNIGKDFSNWIKGQIDIFIEKEDYIKEADLSLALKGELDFKGQNRIDYHLTLETAKQIAMMSRTDKGKEIRLYFIKIEEEFKKLNNPFILASRKDLLKLALDQEEKIELMGQKTKMLEVENMQKSEIINEQEQALEEKEKIIDKYIGISEEATPSAVGKKLGLKPRLFIDTLKAMGYYASSGEPYQKYINCGYFKIKYTEPKLIHGEMRKFPHFYITPKGFDYFFKKVKAGEFDNIKI